MADKEKIESKGEELGISGFSLGVVGLVFSGSAGGLLLSLIGLIFCMIQQKKHKSKFGKIGLILNIVGVILNIVIIIVYVKFIAPALNQTSLV